MSESLSLWVIEAELANLLNLRDELAETGEGLAPLDLAIQEYIAREVKKCDGIRSYLKHAEMMVDAATTESHVQSKRAKVWQGRIDRLKDFCLVTMEAMPWKPDQVRRIDGKTGSLLLKTNGGKQRVVVTKADLIPEELVRYEGSISGEAWKALAKMIDGCKMTPWFSLWNGRQDVQMMRVPQEGRIAEALSAKCPICDGPGMICNGTVKESCPQCDGDGLNRVPGAHFAARNSHVEIR